MKTKLFMFTWRSNFGNEMMIIEAMSKESAYILGFSKGLPDKECAIDDYECEELEITNTERIVHVSY